MKNTKKNNNKDYIYVVVEEHYDKNLVIERELCNFFTKEEDARQYYKELNEEIKIVYGFDYCDEGTVVDSGLPDCNFFSEWEDQTLRAGTYIARFDSSKSFENLHIGTILTNRTKKEEYGREILCAD